MVYLSDSSIVHINIEYHNILHLKIYKHRHIIHIQIYLYILLLSHHHLQRYPNLGYNRPTLSSPRPIFNSQQKDNLKSMMERSVGYG